MIDHDRLFKELLSTFFLEFLELFFPEMSTYIDPTSVVFLDKEVFTDVTEGDQFEADIVARVRFQGAQQEAAFFLILLELQSYNQSEFGRRLFRYFARFYEKYNLPVYPIVLFSYDTPYRMEPDRFVIGFPDLEVLNFRFRVVQLNRLNWRDFLSQPNPVASALMAKMNIAPEDRTRVKVECLRLLVTLRLDRARMQLISGFIDTYLRLGAEEERRFQTELRTVLPQEEQEMALEIITSWMEQGLQQGRQEGRGQGMEQIVSRQLTRLFGTLPEVTEARIHDLSPDALGELAEALLDFNNMSELEEWLDARTA